MDNNPFYHNFTKSQIRTKLLEARRQLSHNFVTSASNQIFRNLITSPEYIQAKTIALYWAIKNEVSTQEIIEHILVHKKSCYLPVIIAPQQDQKYSLMVFARYDQTVDTSKGDFDIPQPIININTPVIANVMQVLSEIDLVIVPMVGFDQNCNRMGRGHGYYDIFLSGLNQHPLANRHTRVIGLAYHNQCVDQLPVTQIDVPMDAILTEVGWYYRH